jgi:aldose 1-epimerase
MEHFGTLPDGRTVNRFTLERSGAVRVRILDWGGIIQSVETPDRAGERADIVLGMADLDGYVAGTPYFGGIIGRVANRIAHGRFALDGHTYQLACNTGRHTLHGGTQGFDRHAWDVVRHDGASLILRRTSPHGEEGYPGALTTEVHYTLDDNESLVIGYRATCDAPTVVNLTNHSYWNLSGDPSQPVDDHVITLHASRFTPVDATLIPTGLLQPVDGSPFDLRAPVRLGDGVARPHEQLAYAGGYDHNWVLDGLTRDDHGLRHAVHVHDPHSGRTLDVHTSEPGMQFYTGNFLDGTLTGKAGVTYGHRAGFCLETQHFPDSPNHPEFPTVVLRPGQTLRSTTRYSFGVLAG